MITLLPRSFLSHNGKYSSINQSINQTIQSRSKKHTFLREFATVLCLYVLQLRTFRYSWKIWNTLNTKAECIDDPLAALFLECSSHRDAHDIVCSFVCCFFDDVFYSIRLSPSFLETRICYRSLLYPPTFRKPLRTHAFHVVYVLTVVVQVPKIPNPRLVHA